MAVYKVWLTVRDSYGNVKEIDGGNINVEFDGIGEEDIDKIRQELLLDSYITKDNAKDTLDPVFATDEEVDKHISDVQQQVEQNGSFKYSGFFDDNTSGGVN